MFKRLSNALAAFSLLLIIALGAASARAANTNLIANPQVTSTDASGQPTNWTQNSWGTNTTSFNYVTNSGHGDSTSLEVTMSNHTSGDAKWIPDASSVTGGQTYTYNDWYQSNVNTELDAQYTDASGNVTYAYLATEAPSGTWTQAMTNFTVPANVTKVSVLHLLYSNGTLQTDDYTLTGEVAPTDGNLIANPSFESAVGSVPLDWNQDSWGTNNAQFTYNTNLGRNDSNSATVSISSYTSGDAKWAANPVSVTPGVDYTYSDWYQSNTSTQVVAAFIDGSGNYTYTPLANAAPAATWAQYTSSFTVPANTTYVQMFHLLGSTGTLTIDDVNLSLTPATSNLIQNPSVETADPSNPNMPLDWSTNAWGTNKETFKYLTTGGHTGSHAVQVNMTSWTDGDAKWYANPVSATQDTQYQFTEYYKASIATEVDAAFYMTDGSTQYQYIALPNAASSWTKLTTDFEVPVGTQSMQILHIIHGVGTLTIDDQSLQAYTPTGFTSGMVSITFDDGFASMYTNGLPLLKKYGFKSTEFIPTGLINTPGYMTPTQLKALHNAGEEIGSHTVTHTDMLTETPTQWVTEFSKSKSQLQTWTGASITDFAYPNGLYSGATTSLAKKYYASTRGVEDGLNSKDDFNPYDVKVQNMFDTTTTAQVADWVKQAKATNTWLVLVYHSVDSTTGAGDDFNVTPAQLDAQLAAIKASGLPVMTYHQAMVQAKQQTGL